MCVNTKTGRQIIQETAAIIRRDTLFTDRHSIIATAKRRKKWTIKN